jgi:hypothetical protein
LTYSIASATECQGRGHGQEFQNLFSRPRAIESIGDISRAGTAEDEDFHARAGRPFQDGLGISPHVFKINVGAYDFERSREQAIGRENGQHGLRCRAKPLPFGITNLSLEQVLHMFLDERGPGRLEGGSVGDGCAKAETHGCILLLSRAACDARRERRG